jgi:uncharacterized protein YecE (DUF72 family)
MIKFRIGCSGYQYNAWKHFFYPDELPKANWFEFYCQHFNTIELNMTYYKFPRAPLLRKWYDRSPADFTFSVKAPRVITHFKKLNDAKNYLKDFYNAVSAGLQEKTGCVLFQFPSHFQYSENDLERIAELLDPSFRNVVEFRNASWWNTTVYNSLAGREIIFSGMSHPELPDAVVVSNKTLYFRFHGVPHLYSSRYQLADLEAVASQVIESNAKHAYIIFNNAAEGAAITNAKQFQEIIELVH